MIGKTGFTCKTGKTGKTGKKTGKTGKTGKTDKTGKTGKTVKHSPNRHGDCFTLKIRLRIHYNLLNQNKSWKIYKAISSSDYDKWSAM